MRLFPLKRKPLRTGTLGMWIILIGNVPTDLRGLSKYYRDQYKLYAVSSHTVGMLSVL